jgi:membrane associated rhomboid family serine protease
MGFFDSGNSFQKTSPAVLNLIIANVLVFIAQYVFGESNASDLFALHHYKADIFKPHQVITHMFMHGSILHLLFNMYGLFMFGAIIEKIWGAKRFLLFYFACGLGAAIIQLAFYAYEFREIDKARLNLEEILIYQKTLSAYATVGASGAIMGVVVAFGYLFPNTEMMIMPIPIPVKAKWLVMVIVAIDLFSGIANRPGDNVAHFAHLGGAITGFILVLYWNKTNKKTFY